MLIAANHDVIYPKMMGYRIKIKFIDPIARLFSERGMKKPVRDAKTK